MICGERPLLWLTKTNKRNSYGATVKTSHLPPLQFSAGYVDGRTRQLGKVE